ncbi:MAG TPA: plastocyanin/azurin family copper-binding protein [Candidatus Baltobacteraceae bacterium]|nr:plastocyanin/azurin family copper-binding protein [Candidatus Baltobacteraceae bacterium]
MRAFHAAAIALALASCTPNGIGSTGGGGGGAVVHTVDINLTIYGNATGTPYGQGAGFKPLILNVSVGDSIVFKNADSFAHTATLIPANKTSNETSFPSNYPFSGSALSQSGSALSAGWSSGELPAGSTSQTIIVDKAGTYLYGCAIHYGAPMRAAIVAQ